MSQQISKEEIAAELKRICDSPMFVRKFKVKRILRYCVQQLILECPSPKEYAIATEALGKPLSWDPREDSVIRVYMGRIRKMLSQYYEQEGIGNPIRIVFRPWSYLPEVMRLGEEIPLEKRHPQYQLGWNDCLKHVKATTEEFREEFMNA